MAEIMVLCGFFMIYLVEEITHIVVDKMHQGPKVADVNGHTPSTKVRIENICFSYRNSFRMLQQFLRHLLLLRRNVAFLIWQHKTIFSWKNHRLFKVSAFCDFLNLQRKLPSQNVCKNFISAIFITLYWIHQMVSRVFWELIHYSFCETWLVYLFFEFWIQVTTLIFWKSP